VTTAAILANPASGKDIRRLVAHGSVFDNQEKVRMVRRLLLGLARTGVERVIYMPDAYGIVPRALNSIEVPLLVEAIEMPVANSQEDTIRAAEIAETLGAGVLVVLGGDGTSRAAAKGTREVPIMALSTGTNNVFPVMIETTVAGLAAGLVAANRLPREATCRRACLLEILMNDEPADIALVDAAVYTDLFVASRAVWDMDKVPRLFMTRAAPEAIGLSAIGGQLTSILPGEPRGLALTLAAHNGGTPVTAAIAPGMFATVHVQDMETMLPGRVFAVEESPCLIAVDGEREVIVRRGQRAGVRLSTDGPLVVDIRATMARARDARLFTGPANGKNNHEKRRGS